jgi:uncharacterized repeat protein (TIGR03803 family)
VRSLGVTTNDAQYPPAGVIEGRDGVLYGVTEYGGAPDLGTVFKLNKDGTSYTVLRTFRSSGSDAANPSAPLLEGTDGVLYGTTFSGGNADLGTIFKLNKNGSGYQVLHVFQGGDGAYPLTGLVEASDGLLYGTASGETELDGGMVFKLRKDGGGFTVVRRFPAAGGDGKWPESSPVEGPDGALYGTTPEGGSNGVGTLFKLNKNGTGFVVLRHFGTGGDDGAQSVSALVAGGDGAFYGTTVAGGAVGLGSVFRLGPGYENRVWITPTLAGARLRFGGLPDRTYQLQRTVDFSNWRTVASVVTPLLPFVEFEDTNAPPGGAFYRSYRP